MNTLLLILECGILLNSATTIGATDENPLQHRTESLTIALQGSVAAVTPLFGPVQGSRNSFIPQKAHNATAWCLARSGQMAKNDSLDAYYLRREGRPLGLRVHCAGLPTNNAFTGEMRSMQL